MPLLLALLLATAAPLDEDPAFREGLAAFKELRLEAAAVSFQRAALDDSRPAPERARVQMWLGATYGQLGDLPRARSAFAFALALSPDSLLPVRVSPKVSAVLDEERGKALTEREELIAEKARAAAEAAARQVAAEEGAGPPRSTDAQPGIAGETPAPEAVSPSTADDEAGLNGWLLGAGGVGALAAVLAVGSVVTLGFALERYDYAESPTTKQYPAVAAEQLSGLLIASSLLQGALLVPVSGAAVVLLGVGLWVE